MSRPSHDWSSIESHIGSLSTAYASANLPTIGPRDRFYSQTWNLSAHIAVPTFTGPDVRQSLFGLANVHTDWRPMKVVIQLVFEGKTDLYSLDSITPQSGSNRFRVGWP